MNSMSRRNFLKAAAFGTAGLMGGLLPGCSGTYATARSKSKRPNVLFVICDDLNDSVAGMGGHPQAKTPNINRLMRRGVRFTNAHANNPLCSPSRSSMLAGLYPSTVGYYGWKQSVNRWTDNKIITSSRSVVEHFKLNGYAVYGTGKITHGVDRKWKAWKHADGTSGFGITPNHGPWPSDGKSRKGVGHPSMPPGLIDPRWRSFGPLSDVPDVPPDPKNETPGYKGWSLYGKPFRYVSENDRDLMPDELSAQWAIERLREHHKKPFFLAVGFMRPHVPMYAPKKYFDMFPLDEIELPPYLSNDLDDIPHALHGSYGQRCFDNLMAHGGIEHWKKWIQAYLACVTFVDDQFGKVLDALDKSPYADNTIIIFTSDHGYHMGEKNQLSKRTVWEESTRTPLVIVAPGLTRPNTECGHPVSLIDMYPTLIDLCNLPKNPNANGNGYPLDGHSIRPFLKDPENGTWDGPSVALSCIAGPLKKGEELAEVERHQFTVRSKRWRYTLCNTGEEELYDHKNDPQEWTNLANDPIYAGVKKKLRSQLCLLAGLPY